jgi:hypothetical protein
VSKVLEASCQAGVVTIEGQAVPCEILSEGVGSSTGTAIIDEDKAYYIAKNSGDIKKAIEDLSSIIQQIEVILTALDAVTVSPGASAAAIAALTALRTTFSLTKDTLR